MNEDMKAAWLEISQMLGEPTREELDVFLRTWQRAIQAEREENANKVEEFARKWWKIHCDSNLHYSSTLKAHQDFCALQAAIRARGQS